jgi:hypothetical protein
MSNVLDDDIQQRILALGRLGWALRRIEAATGVRRETAGGYLRAAGLAVRGRGRPGEGAPKPAITPGVSTDSGLPRPDDATLVIAHGTIRAHKFAYSMASAP